MGENGAALYSDQRVGFYASDGLFVAVWDDAPRIEQMHALAEHGRAFEADHGPAALLNVAAAGTPSFPDDVRRVATEFTADATLFQRARAHVILMSGFSGIAVRAFINTFILLGKPPRPTKMLGSVEEAARWLVPHVEQPRWSAEEIGAHANALVAAHVS